MKTGDKVVCINNSRITENEYADHAIYHLVVGDVYVVDSTEYSGSLFSDVIYINDTYKTTWYYSERFVTLKEYRKLKLKKINEKT